VEGQSQIEAKQGAGSALSWIYSHGAWPEALKLVPLVLGLLAPTTLVCSMVYNWAFFETVDPTGLQLLTLSDHVVTALEWVPFVVASNFAAIPLTLFTLHLLKGHPPLTALYVFY
jgi:hypothetical protein